MMRWTLIETSRLLTLGLAGLLMANPASSQEVIFDHGPPRASGGGVEVTIRVLAEDVLLSQAEEAGGARVWVVGDPNAWSGTLEYFFFDADGNLPATVPFAAGTGQNVQIVGNEYTFEFEESVLLDANTPYWFGLHMDADFDVNTDCCLFWSLLEQGVQIGSSAASAEAGDFDNWGLTPNHHAFQLLPEPSLASGLLAGLFCLIARPRRRGPVALPESVA